MKIVFFLIFGISLFHSFSYSQDFANDLLPCATEPYLSEDLIYYQQNLQNYRFLTDDTIYIPIQVHIVGNDDGIGYLSETRVRQAFCGLNKSFEQTKIQFYLTDEFNYINNSQWFEHESFGPGRDMIAINNFLEY